ncbi:MAG: mechanosensitive ion channel family protein [Candidatus Cloacimonas sp.]|nr:mechanosensitive ion channel family protein [Candidatus Cloacimonadota bacterium]
MYVVSNLVMTVKGWLTPQMLTTLIRVALIVVIGFPIVKAFASLASRSAKKKGSLQAEMLARRTVTYTGIAIILIMLLNEFGFKLSAILGALGIFGMAIGFASQTSVSNIISGIFLITEKPFEIGDYIKVGATTGTVLSVDLLSVKLKTLDNQFIRVPNESLIKAEITNVSKYSTKGLILTVKVARKESIEKVMNLFKEIAKANEFCLKQPEPTILLNNFDGGAIEFRCTFWYAENDFMNLKNTISTGIREKFEAEGIEIISVAS